jgi:membrane protein implicated in regulation of membrane protease activity
MPDLYTLCAVLGGTLFLCQLAASLLGLGGDHDTDACHDVSGDHDASHDAGHDGGHGLCLHGLFNFRALVVGITFFGLTGRVAGANQLSGLAVFAIAAGAGLVALVSMALLMQALSKLQHDGTLRIQQALGEEGSVYLTIPANKSGLGKVMITVQGRLMELPAVSSQGELKAGTKVEVVDIVDSNTLVVAPVPMTEGERKASQVDEMKGGTHV